MLTSPFEAEHEALRTTVRRFVEREVVPHVDAWEQRGSTPGAVIAGLGAMGLLPLLTVEPVDLRSAVVVGEELARAGADGVGAAVAAHAWVALPLLAGRARPSLRADVDAALDGRTVLAAPLSIDAAALPTAHAVSGGWLLEGTARSVAGALAADRAVVPVQAPRGSVLLAVDLAAEGVAVEPTDAMGLWSAGLGDVVLRGALARPAAAVSAVGDGVRAWEAASAVAGLVAAAAAVARADQLVDAAVRYARDREVFGRSLASLQVQRHRFAELATRVEAARRLVYDAVDRRAVRTDTETVAARAAAARLASVVADEVLQVHGGFGYAEDSGIARAWRDARVRRLVVREAPATPNAAARPAADAVGTPRRLALWEERHRQLRLRARELVGTELAPHVPSWEAQGDFPRDVFRLVGGQGFLGLKFDPRWGGGGPDLVSAAVWVQELARCGAGGVAADLGASSDLAALYVDVAGTDAQRERWLRPSIAGTAIGALAVTEPDAGSDVAAIRTRAARDGTDWLLDGAKTYITNGSWCDYVVVAATTEPGSRHAGITLFVVEAGTPGFTRRRLPMLGWRTSHTGELTLQGVRVPADHLLGEVGGGFATIMANFAWERVSMALAAVVSAEEALLALARSAMGIPPPAVPGGRPLHAGDLAVEIAEARALTEHALRLAVLRDPAAPRAAAMAKLVTQRLAVRTADEVLQSEGLRGYRLDHPAQRRLRDARLGPIGGGTDEIMREIVARTMGL